MMLNIVLLNNFHLILMMVSHILSEIGQQYVKNIKKCKKRGNFAEKAKNCNWPKFGKLCMRRANAKFHRV